MSSVFNKCGRGSEFAVAGSQVAPACRGHGDLRTCVWMCACADMCACMWMCVDMCGYMRVDCVEMHVCVHVCGYVGVVMCMDMCAYDCVCVCVCVCV